MAPSKNVYRNKRILLLLIFIFLFVSYFAVSPFHQLIHKIFKMFATGDFEVVKNFVSSYGPYAMIVSFLLMIFQSVAAPLPAFLITFSNANLFGWWQGAILSWTSAMAGAAVCFYIARILGQDGVEKLTSKTALHNIDEFFKKWGKQSILIARLLPFISFDIVSYAAGLTSMSFVDFFVATGLGQLPATIIYSYVGGMLSGGARMLVTGLFILFALSILVFTLQRFWEEKKGKQSESISHE